MSIMKALDPAPKFLIYAILRAIRHPRTPITYYYCPDCKIRFPASSAECPKCHDKIRNTPEQKTESAVPWWGAVGVIIIGIACWVISATYSISGLDEAGRALVYVPLGSLFGMSQRK